MRVDVKTVRETDVAVRLGGDFRRLWAAYSVSEMGTAVGAGALPLVAILVLESSDLQVSLLAVLSGITGALIALPLGPWVEFRRKRPVMIGADLVRFAALGSVPVAAAAGVLTYAQLCLVAVAQTVGTIAFTAASGAHLKALVPVEHRTEANGKFETTLWTANSAGPPIGGLLISWLGATASVALDATSFILSALGIRRLRTPEPPPPVRIAEHHWGKEITGGWRHIFGHRGLSALFWNAMVFGGCIMAASPLIAVLMLRDLGFAPWQYGLALGLPCLGGILGSVMAKRLVRRVGQRTVLLAFGVGRTLWMGLIPLAPPGTKGLILIIVAETLLLWCAGVFNPTFATYRMNATSDAYMSRVVSAWSISSKSAQPAFIAAGGLLAAATSPRAATAAMATVLVTSAALLPWRHTTRNNATPAGAAPRYDHPESQSAPAPAP
jgi:predicted MFS family arabinose efflux permease